jgi:hypothetical protein
MLWHKGKTCSFHQGAPLSKPVDPVAVQQDFWRERNLALLQLPPQQDGDLQNEREKARMRQLPQGT